MKNNDIISASELEAIIAKYGPDRVSVDGSWPETYVDADDLGLEQDDKFRVVINYANEVQFHLIDDNMRAIVTTGLKGRYDCLDGWVA